MVCRGQRKREPHVHPPRRRVGAGNGSALLHDDDAILILGRTAPNEAPQYWEIVLRDPFKTRRIAWAPLQHSSPMTPRVRGCIASKGPIERRYTICARRSTSSFVTWTRETARRAASPYVHVRGDDRGSLGQCGVHTEAEIVHLVWELRKKIEPERASGAGRRSQGLAGPRRPHERAGEGTDALHGMGQCRGQGP